VGKYFRIFHHSRPIGIHSYSRHLRTSINMSCHVEAVSFLSFPICALCTMRLLGSWTVWKVRYSSRLRVRWTLEQVFGCVDMCCCAGVLTCHWLYSGLSTAPLEWVGRNPPDLARIIYVVFLLGERRYICVADCAMLCWRVDVDDCDVQLMLVLCSWIVLMFWRVNVGELAVVLMALCWCVLVTLC
jgi:hypothetical protein